MQKLLNSLIGQLLKQLRCFLFLHLVTLKANQLLQNKSQSFGSNIRN